MQNIDFINGYDPEYVLVLGGDHIYKMNYDAMLREHKKKKSDATIAVVEVPMEEASRFGIMNTHESGEIYEFEEKPKNPKSNLASMGIYIFNWDTLKEALVHDSKIHEDSDFGKHIIPYMLDEGCKLGAYKFTGYWKDVGTIESYWACNMDLANNLPVFDLYDTALKIYTNSEHQPPQYCGPNSAIQTSIVSEGSEIYGFVYNSILGPDVIVEEGAVINDSIIMEGCVIGKDSKIERTIIDEKTTIGESSYIGFGDDIVNEDHPHIYDTGITVIGAESSVPSNVTIGKNCVVSGITEPEDYIEDTLNSGKSLIRDEVEL